MLEEKIETLTKEVVALRQVIEKSGLGGAAKAAASDEAPAKAAAKKAPAKKKVEPEHDADEVGAIMRKLAKRSEADKKKVQKHIKSTESADLADLLTKPELFDAAFAFADAILNPPADDDDDIDADDDDDDDV